jgi:peptidoglycan/xylan/chitin deacetylase (PgdA/CDA1 family)
MLLFLLYHKIEDAAKSQKYSISPKLFETQVSRVKQSGIDVVDPGMMAASARCHSDGIVFTFDDGTLDHFETVRPVLREFNTHSIFYIPTGKLSKEGHLSGEHVAQLFEEGHVIGSHAHSHRRLDVLEKTSQLEELEISRDIIGGITGTSPIHFAPPGGFLNHGLQQNAERAGYTFLRSTRWGYNSLFNPMRIEVVPMIGNLGSRFLDLALRAKGEQWLKLLYSFKNVMRTVVPERQYHKFQNRIAQKLGKIHSETH